MRFREETEQFALCFVQALQLCSMFLQSDMFMSCAASCSCWCHSAACFFSLSCSCFAQLHVHAVHGALARTRACMLALASLGGGGEG